MKGVFKLLFVGLAMLTITSASAQENCGALYGPDSVTTTKNLGMFNQYYQMQKYDDLYPYWEYLFQNAPCVSKRILYNGPKIVKMKMKSLQDNSPEEYDARIQGLIDTVMLCYELRIKHWGEPYDVKSKWATDMYLLRPDLKDSALDMYKESLEKLGNEFDYVSTMFYMQTLVKEYQDTTRDKIKVEDIYNTYFKLADIIAYNIEKGNARYKSAWVKADTISMKFVRPFLTCEKIEEYFKPQTDAKSDDLALLKKVSDLLDANNCSQSAYALDIAIKMFDIEPSYDAAVAIGRSYHAMEDYPEAIKWYQRGVKGLKDTASLEKVNMSMATLYATQGNISEAKNYAQTALTFNPNNGSAHLIVAASYLGMKTSCSADGIDGASVYWAAVDRAAKAKQVDPSVEDKANEFIAKYSARFIKQEQAFFKNFGHNQGDSYTVPCIGVTTTIRFNP